MGFHFQNRASWELVRSVAEDLGMQIDPSRVRFPRQGVQSVVFVDGDSIVKFHRPRANTIPTPITSFQLEPRILDTIGGKVVLHTPPVTAVGNRHLSYRMEKIDGNLLANTRSFLFNLAVNDRFATDKFIDDIAHFMVSFDRVMREAAFSLRAAPALPRIEDIKPVAFPASTRPLLRVWEHMKEAAHVSLQPVTTRNLHNDLVPTNIFETPRGLAVVDFGNAVHGDPHDDLGHITRFLGISCVARLVERINQIDPSWNLSMMKVALRASSNLVQLAEQSTNPIRHYRLHTRAREIAQYVQQSRCG